MSNSFNRKEHIQKVYKMNNLFVPNWMQVVSRLIIFFMIVTVAVLAFTPWQQSSEGSGRVVSLDPNNRIQDISATVEGRIREWYVSDGSVVKKGDPIVAITDNDPLFMTRLISERDAIFRKYNAAKEASEISLKNYKRQKNLFNQGLTSKVKVEKSKIVYKKNLSSEATAAAYLAGAEVKLSRQQTQTVNAPSNGTILRTIHGSSSLFIKAGDTVASFYPEDLEPAVEVFIDGNDLPLIQPGLKTRIQFEGFPALQFSGWPNYSIGTFGGVVYSVDPTSSNNNKFRIIIKPDPDDVDWPKGNFLRQNTKVLSWVLLETVSLGYELWRQFNAFPPILVDDFKIKKNKGGSKPKKKEKKNSYEKAY